MDNNASTIPRSFSDCTGYFDDKMARYFGVDRTISDDKVVELLVSTSFGANSILYAVWLGYLMGMWAMLIHSAWCLSFCFLAFFSKRIYTHTSIHDFLSCHFGPSVKRVSAICSCVGLLYFTGWEVAVTKSNLEVFSIQFFLGETWIWSLLLIAVVCVALLYTIIGGQQANGWVNAVVNRIRFILLGIIVLGILNVLCAGKQPILNMLLPRFGVAIKNLGVAGLVTNIFINLSWQFVDNSSWQILSSGRMSRADDTCKSLKRTALIVLIVYAAETFLGAALRGVSGLNSENILSGIIYIIGKKGAMLIAVTTVILLLLSLMSLVDGMSLSVAHTIMVDLNFLNNTNRLRRHKLPGIQTARMVTLLLGILAAWGVQYILGSIGKNVFDFVYIFTVAQLSLIGPILIGLVLRPQCVFNMWIGIVVSLIIGIALNVYSNLSGILWIGDMAGATTAMSSLGIGLLLYHKWNKRNVHREKEI